MRHLRVIKVPASLTAFTLLSGAALARFLILITVRTNMIQIAPYVMATKVREMDPMSSIWDINQRI